MADEAWHLDVRDVARVLDGSDHPPHEVQPRHLVRNLAGRWPPWFAALRQLYAAAPSPAVRLRRQRLEAGDFPIAASRAAALREPLRRTARLASIAFGGEPEPPMNLPDTLLMQAYRSQDAGAEQGRCTPELLLDAPETVSLPVLLVHDSGGAEEPGLVMQLRLWRVDAVTDPADRLALVPAPASQALQTDAGFQSAIGAAGALLDRTLPTDAACRGSAVVWDLQPLGDFPPVIDIVGASLGAALALGALFLVRKDLPEDDRNRLDAIDWTRVGVTATLDARSNDLGWITGLGSKWQAWAVHQRQGVRLFVHTDQNDVPGGQLGRAGSISDLIAEVFAECADIDADQARLLAEVRRGSDLTDAHTTLLVAVARSQPLSVRGWLLRELASCAIDAEAVFGDEVQRVDLQFVELTLQRDGAQRAGPTEPSLGRLLQRIEAGDGQHDPSRPDILVLRGAPGGGKSTVTRHHRMVRALQTLRDWPGFTRDADEGRRPELCIGLPLGWLQPQGLAAAIDRQWTLHFGAMPGWAHLQRRHALRIFVDGVNELGAEQRVATLRSLLAWLRDLKGREGPTHVLSVRSLEQADLAHARPEGGIRTVSADLQAWSRKQVEAYCREHRGEAGRRLWEMLLDREDLIDLCSVPLHVAAQVDFIASGLLDRPAGSVAELFCGLLLARLQREARAGRRLAPPGASGWLGEAGWQRLNDLLDRVRARGGFHVDELPLDGPLLRGLMAQASHAQTEGATAPLAPLHGVAGLGTEDRRYHWLAIVAALGIGDLDGDLFRFRHQKLWQDFFSALWLIRQGPAGAPDLRRAAMDSSWTEPVRLAVALDPAPGRWIAHLLPIHPELAGHASAGRRDELDRQEPALMARLRRRLLGRSTSLFLPVRRRHAAGLALGDAGDPRYEVHVNADGVRWMWPRPEYWVRIPAGEYLIGCAESDQPDERPVTRALLENDLEMAFAPLTNAEFGCFVRDGGYHDGRPWWRGDAALAWLSGQDNGDDEQIGWLSGMRDLALSWGANGPVPPEFQALFAPGTPEDWLRAQARAFMSYSPDDWEAEIRRRYGTQRWHRPLWWGDDRFNAAAQPCTGISLFEAQSYVNWLQQRSGHAGIDLPGELAWEAAARLPAGLLQRLARWLPASWRMNVLETGLNRPSAPGVFPLGSRKRLTDTLGNVFEWTTSTYSEQHDRALLEAKSPQDLASNARWVVRGGSWNNPAAFARPSYRNHYAPGLRHYGLGVRLVRRPIP